MTDGLMLTYRTTRDEILLHLDLQSRVQSEHAAQSANMPHAY